ncbi:hypothetical protein WSM22_44160 [Cytophagales bacterium WSM2-2]|nr:hypothetical protein WSM22_44160 [Cytophagales bacterium WSM2-2]
MKTPFSKTTPPTLLREAYFESFKSIVKLAAGLGLTELEEQLSKLCENPIPISAPVPAKKSLRFIVVVIKTKQRYILPECNEVAQVFY